MRVLEAPYRQCKEPRDHLHIPSMCGSRCEPSLHRWSGSLFDLVGWLLDRFDSRDDRCNPYVGAGQDSGVSQRRNGSRERAGVLAASDHTPVRTEEGVADPQSARFEAMFRRHYGAVVRYAVRRVGIDAAGEVVSETFLIAWRRLDVVPDDALPWLYATARRVVANEVRRRDRQLRLGERLATLRSASVDNQAEVLPEALRVQTALDALSESDREAIRLHAWEHLGSADAAAVLGCSTSAYKVRLHRARRRLERLLATLDAQSSLTGTGDDHDRHSPARG